MEQLGEHVRVDARHRDVRPDAVDDERAQQEPQPPLQVGVLRSDFRAGLFGANASSRNFRDDRRHATLPPAASIAAFAPLVAPMPVSFTAFASSPDLMTFADFAIAGHDAGGLERQQVDLGDRQPREVGQADFGVIVLRERHEAALRQPALQRHLAAFEADLVEAARARLLALVAASRGLAEARADAAADAALRLLASHRPA